MNYQFLSFLSRPELTAKITIQTEDRKSAIGKTNHIPAILVN